MPKVLYLTTRYRKSRNKLKQPFLSLNCGVRSRKQLKKQAGTDSDKPKRRECNKKYAKRNNFHAHRPPFQAQIEPISYPF
ncbi:MAG TPA: hypothetical protein PLP86_07515, partial [Armatimonadota bacterium]|nr:hypothetical protein [Armatimonadota bacterium]